jgi:hypothetical protein
MQTNPITTAAKHALPLICRIALRLGFVEAMVALIDLYSVHQWFIFGLLMR